MFCNIKKGFTFVELVVVVWILAVLSITIFMATGWLKEQSQDVVTKSNIIALTKALDLYKQDCWSIPPALSISGSLQNYATIWFISPDAKAPGCKSLSNYLVKDESIIE